MSDSTPANGDQVARRFAKRLRDLRQARGMSQEALAERASARGVPLLQTTIAKIEAGQRAVRIGEAWGLAKALDVQLDDLLGDPLLDLSEEELRAQLEEIQARIPGLERMVAESQEVATVAMASYQQGERRLASARERLNELVGRLDDLHPMRKEGDADGQHQEA